MVTYRGRGISNVIKVPEFDKIVDFGPIWEAVDPLRMVSQLKSIPFCNQCSKSKTFDFSFFDTGFVTLSFDTGFVTILKSVHIF